MPVWPVSLPTAPTAQGLKETVPDNTLRSAVDAGPPKLRRRFTSAVRAFAMSFVLDFTQAQTLDDFYTTTLAGGALPFDWVHPRTGAAVSFRFVGPPVFSYPDEAVVAASLSLEVLP